MLYMLHLLQHGPCDFLDAKYVLCSELLGGQ